MASHGWVCRFKAHAYFLSVKVSGWATTAAKLNNIYCIEIIIIIIIIIITTTTEVDYVAQPSFNMDITGLF
jgi:hypothetical protein